ncbi:hypothetical protein CLV98_101762 [Dyadobacter jejuensis]|uniref:Uncharacterized protein n=1 Tax=Dyadobacter jejuensis TaxID=1082580 RepID=A0A316BDK7_9BACT|nr:hypothetical protein [Dyadobacter jejuensis]PWJ60577.1 hypothetical protein CLV98_101762 [Dyadobacter jejuensis]
MIASIGDSGIDKIKAGSVIMVSGTPGEVEAREEISKFLAEHQMQDLGYFAISDGYYILYHKTTNHQEALA